MWILAASILGLLIASLVTGGVFRWHPNGHGCVQSEPVSCATFHARGLMYCPSWVKCAVCGVADRAKRRSRGSIRSSEAVIVALTVFHMWRYQSGTWIPEAGDLLWLFLARDILFSVALLLVFVYDMKYTLILPVYVVPATILAFGINLALGISLTSLLSGMIVLFLFFLVQHSVSGGRLLGSGDVIMGVLLGAMLGFTGGIFAVMIAYVLGACVGVGLVATGRATGQDRVPFGTFGCGRIRNARMG